MCGIAGIFAYLDVAPAVDPNELGRMSARMAQRGPDGSGEWYSPDRSRGCVQRPWLMCPTVFMLNALRMMGRVRCVPGITGLRGAEAGCR